MFETALPTRSRNRRRWAAFPAAVGLHLTALVAVVAADYWSLNPVTPPTVNAVFHTVSLPPPPAPLAGGGARPQPRPQPQPEPVKPDQPVQPTVIEDLEPVAAEAPQLPVTLFDPSATGPAGPGIPGGSETGHPDGVPGGSDTGDPAAVFPATGSGSVPPLAAPSGPIRMNARVKGPEIIPGTRVEPRYPEPARRVRLQGAVILEAVIDEHGNVTGVRVVKGMPMGLEQAAIEAVSRWKFQPATLDGRPVAVYFNLTVNFFVR
jgi:TonB family protein